MTAHVGYELIYEQMLEKTRNGAEFFSALREDKNQNESVRMSCETFAIDVSFHLHGAK